MRYEEFKETIKNKMIERLGDYKRVTIQPVVKNNGIVYDGLIVQDPVCNISPTIYLNPFYDKFLNGVSMEGIIEDIMNTYVENKPQEDFNISLFRDYEKAKRNIVMKLVNTEQNEVLLEDLPSREFCDLSIIYAVIVNDFKNGFATILIHKQHMELWGVTEEDLYAAAMENTPRILMHRFECMDRIIEQSHMELECYDISMYILTNKVKIFGATCIAYPKLLKRIADLLEDNLIIIPSSVHEVIIIAEDEARKENTIEELNEMVVETNEAVLTEVEILSNHVYHFNRENEEITF